MHRGSLDYGGSASTFEPIRTLDLSSDRSTATFANVCGSAVAVAVVAVVVEMFFSTVAKSIHFQLFAAPILQVAVHKLSEFVLFATTYWRLEPIYGVLRLRR